MVAGSRSLQAGSRVHHIADSLHVSVRRGREENLAARDPDPNVEFGTVPLTEPADRLLDRQARPHGPLGVVLMRAGCAEHGDHRIADELLDAAAVALQLTTKQVVVTA